MYCRSVILCSLKCVTESIQKIAGCTLASPDVHNTRYRFAQWYQRRVRSPDMTSQEHRNVWRLSCLYVEYFHKARDILHNALQCEPHLILGADYISTWLQLPHTKKRHHIVALPPLYRTYRPTCHRLHDSSINSPGSLIKRLGLHENNRTVAWFHSALSQIYLKSNYIYYNTVCHLFPFHCVFNQLLVQNEQWHYFQCG